jgi:threonine aldolase
MIKFDSDYLEGAHPKIMQKLFDTNFEQTVAYSEDEYSKMAAKFIKEKCGYVDEKTNSLPNKNDTDNETINNCAVHFLVGGTQTNLTLISAALRPHQGVLSAITGHINIHESGAIEATGHKVIELQSTDGKLTSKQVTDAYFSHFNDCNKEHCVQPKLVYISNPTELGTIYSKEELLDISKVCKDNDLLLYMDGARLGYALTSAANDLDLPTIAQCCDAFYIGGTKVGALFGEALVITNPSINKDFRYIIKQKGGLLAKGRLLGVQFLELFRDDLYFKIGRHANDCAQIIKDSLVSKGYPFLTESSTNQQFPIMPDRDLAALDSKYSYSYWQRIDADHSAVRFCTGWATKEEDARQLAEDIIAF